MNIVPILPVKSTAIAGMGYEPVSRTLAIRFHGREHTHHYRDVPEEVWHRMCGAPSVGAAFAQHVRDKYSHVIVPAERRGE
jgi:hypothetical protein